MCFPTRTFHDDEPARHRFLDYYEWRHRVNQRAHVPTRYFQLWVSRAHQSIHTLKKRKVNRILEETLMLEITSYSFDHLLVTDSETVRSFIYSGGKVAPNRMAMKYGAYGIRLNFRQIIAISNLHCVAETRAERVVHSQIVLEGRMTSLFEAEPTINFPLCLTYCHQKLNIMTGEIAYDE